MIKYGDLVQYIKENHVNWNTDLFDVLKGFFESRSNQYSPPPPTSSTTVPLASANGSSSPPIQQDLFWDKHFQPPAEGEYNAQDLINLFST